MALVGDISITYARINRFYPQILVASKLRRMHAPKYRREGKNKKEKMYRESFVVAK